MRCIIGKCCVALLVFSISGVSLAVQLIEADQAVLLQQIDFRDGGIGNTGVNSAIGQITVDIAKANEIADGFTFGYINVADANGNWVVRNLPIFDPDSYDHPTITTKFNLGVADNTDISTFNAYIDYSPSPVTSFSAGSPTPFSVGDVTNAIGGFIESIAGYLSKLDLSGLNFLPDGVFKIVYQKGHENLQTAENQCAPMSIANSLQWLEDYQGITVEHDHKKGLKGDESLVGKLDTYMDRGVRSRQDGDTVTTNQFFEGKLKYASEHNLKDLKIKHQGLSGEGDVNKHGLTSTGKGANIDIDWIISELEKGEDIEMGYLFDGGGHFVEITGAGWILGIPWITYLSDSVQSDGDTDDPNTPLIDETDTRGVDKIDFTLLWGNRMLFEPGDANMALVISQSKPPPVSPPTPIPTVSEWGLIIMGLLLLTAGATVIVWRRRRVAA